MNLLQPKRMLQNVLLQHFFYAVFALMLVSCEEEEKGATLGYTGSVGEVMVVVNNDIWGSEPGDSLKACLGGFQYGLPQDEPMFNVIQVEKKNFAKIFQTHRNVLEVEISSKYPKARLETKRDVYSKGQLYLLITAPNQEQLQKIVNQNMQRITTYFSNKELDRLIQKNLKFGDKALADRVLKEIGVSMVIQKEFDISFIDDTVCYLRLDRNRNQGGFTHPISQGVIAYSYPYNSKQQFLVDSIYAKIEAVLKQYVPGPGDTSYMTLEFNYIPPLTKEVDLSGSFAVESRGLWKMHGAYMGGPYYSISVLDEEIGRIVGIYGFVFAPKFDKREYLREIEAMVRSYGVTQKSK